MKKEIISTPFKSPWIAGQLTIWLFILMGSFLLACLLRFTSFDTEYVSLFAYLINTVAILVGGFISGFQAKKKGWYYGGIQGVIYAISLFIIGFLAFDSSIQLHPFLFVLCAFGLAAMGGIFGENIKTTKKAHF